MAHVGSFVRLRSSALFLASIFLLTFELRANEAFQFAWLSDTHVGSTTGEEDLRRAVRDINSMTGLSFVVLSGDVTEYGSREQLRLAKEILDGVKIPCHVIPGNHDTKWSESGATDFPRLWKADRFVFEHGGFTFIGMHEGPVMKMGDGHWAPQDVRWLEETLKHLKDKDQPLVFVTHYPIDDGIANWYVVLDLLKQYNIQVALCGHIHRNNKASFEGVPGVMGRSNLRGQEAVGGFTIVDVQDSKMTFAEHPLGDKTKAPWHSVVLGRHEYANGTNHARPDFSVNAKYATIKEKWEFKSGYTIAGTPAVWNDLAIVGDASGTVHALSLSAGQERWTFKTRDAVYCTPDTGGELVIVPSTDGTVYALKAGTGQEAWRYATDRPIVASPRVIDGVVYLGSSEGKFRALDLATGKRNWEFNGLSGFVETRPLYYEGKIIFGAWDQYLYALDAKAGKMLWKWRGEKPGTLLSPAACWPIAANGRIFIVAPDRKMTAINAKTGGQVWRTGTYMMRESIGLSEDQTRFFARAMQDFMYAFSTTSPQPEKIWESKPGFSYDINSAMPVEKDGTLFYGTKNGVLFALDAKTGVTKWQHRIGVGVINTVVPLGADQVLAADFDGKVTLVGKANP
jgi:outer membrane protein assembly factor BamB/predicted phosphodiesterase